MVKGSKCATGAETGTSKQPPGTPLIGGQGWGLNAFDLPSGKPFTYILICMNSGASAGGAEVKALVLEICVKVFRSVPLEWP